MAHYTTNQAATIVETELLKSLAVSSMPISCFCLAGWLSAAGEEYLARFLDVAIGRIAKE
jgi:hypothetical protein